MRDAIHVLLVEDNPADVDLARESLEDGKVAIDLSVVADGIAAMDYLKQRGAHANAVRPDLILLDLNLPMKDGREVLAEIKQDESLKAIPVVVLTSSEAETDVAKTYALGANCYVTKPVGLKAFQEIVRSIESFWFAVVKLPGRGPA